MIEIIAGDHSPVLPFVIVKNSSNGQIQGCHVDLTGIGQLWDGPTMASIKWGLRNEGGVEFGRVTLKDGTSRNFWDRDLMLPYVKVHKLAWDKAMADHERTKAAQAQADSEAYALAATHAETMAAEAAVAQVAA